MTEAVQTPFEAQLAAELEEIRAAGLYKEERVIVTPQDASIRVVVVDDQNRHPDHSFGMGRGHR